MTATNLKENPLFQWCNSLKNEQDSELPPFDKIKPEHYLPAFEWAIDNAHYELKKIRDNDETPDFENTIVALETVSEWADLINLCFTNLQIAEGGSELQAIAPQMAQMNAGLRSEIALNEKIFEKVKSIFDRKKSFQLSDEQKMLLDNTYKAFVRNGALLKNEDKEKLRKIDQELSALAPQFSENVRLATNAFELVIDRSQDLAGLPEGVIEAAAHEAEKRGKKNKWVFTLQAPSYIPFITYIDNADLRKQMWMAASIKCNSGEFNNQDYILKTISLREERARLLGFQNHAVFVLEERMAETPEKVFSFLNSMIEVSANAAKRDFKEVQEFKKSLGDPSELQPWDMAYYSEKLKEKKYNFNAEELRPYFALEKVIRGAFLHAEKLFGLKFEKISNVPVYHTEVEVYKVKDLAKNDVGYFLTDFFPRETKKGGAWMTTYRSQGLLGNKVRRPHISIVCNFTKPTPSKPSLLTLQEVETLFHEFGHALHGLLSNVTYASLASPNVYWDFVELPSQIMENWVHEKEALDLFAEHFESKQTIPASLVQKIKDSGHFQAGMAQLRQMQLASLDMLWHTTETKNIQNVLEFEEKATRHLRLFPYIEGTGISCNFSHIFAGGYSAGYYSYKWAEVLDADAFEYFKNEGLFNTEISGRFRDHILAMGGSKHPMELYKKFRGREPDPNALIRRLGLEVNRA